MAQPKVLVFIVPGTWHPSSAYESFASHLRKAGYATHIASLPSFDPTDVDTSCAADTDAVRQQLLGLLEADSSDIVVFAHSYGGIPGGGAAVGLSKSSRIQNSQQGGVIGLVYMSAFIIPEGVGLSEYLGGRKPPYILQDQVRTITEHSFRTSKIPS